MAIDFILLCRLLIYGSVWRHLWDVLYAGSLTLELSGQTSSYLFVCVNITLFFGIIVSMSINMCRSTYVVLCVYVYIYMYVDV